MADPPMTVQHPGMGVLKVDSATHSGVFIACDAGFPPPPRLVVNSTFKATRREICRGSGSGLLFMACNRRTKTENENPGKLKSFEEKTSRCRGRVRHVV